MKIQRITKYIIKDNIPIKELDSNFIYSAELIYDIVGKEVLEHKATIADKNCQLAEYIINSAGEIKWQDIYYQDIFDAKLLEAISKIC